MGPLCRPGPPIRPNSLGPRDEPIASADILRFIPRGAPQVGPVAQWLEPAAHNGLVAGSKSCPAHQAARKPLIYFIKVRDLLFALCAPRGGQR